MPRMLSTRAVISLTLTLSLVGLAGPAAQAAPAGGYTYIHDELGRLVAAVDPTADTAIWSYDATGNITAITRRASSVVGVLEFTPNDGAINDTVTIWGTGFSSTPALNVTLFNGTLATVSSSSATKLVVTVPSGATTGTISVTAPGGSATSVASFTVRGSTAPTASMSSTIGLIGTAVTFTGTNFDTTAANDRLTFNGTFANITSASGTSLSTTVPPSSSSGSVALRTPGGQVTVGDYFVPPSPNTPGDIGYTGRTTVGASHTATTSVAGKKAIVVFEGIAGKRASLKITNETYSGNIAVTIFDPVARRIAKAFSMTTNGFLEPFSLAMSGDYTVFIEPGASATGSATFTLYDVPADPTGSITAGGAPVTVTTAAPGQNATLTFSGIAAQRIFLKSTNSSYTNTVAVTIRNPDGSTLTGPTFMGSNGYIDTTTLGVTGTHTIWANPTSYQTGSITFTLYDVPADPTGTITAGGAPVTVTTTAPGQNAALTFSGTAAQRIFLKSTNSSYTSTVSVTIRNPDGSTLKGPTFMGSNGYIDTQTLPATGTYTIAIDPTSYQTGSITFTLYDVPADQTGTISINGSSVTVTTTTPGQNATRTFSGSSGQIITLATSNSSYPNTIAVTIRNPDGSTLAGPTFMGSGSTIANKTLPATGTYTITFDPTSYQTGSITATLTGTGGGGALAFGDPARSVAPIGSPDQTPADEPSDSTAEQTALAGEIRTLDDDPLAGVTLRIGSVSVATDASGRFLLAGVPAGHQELLIDGETASGHGRTYGLFEVGVDLLAAQTTELSYVIWMPRIDTAHAVPVTSPTTEEVVITSPKLPGLEVRIPSGTTITDEDGEPVTEIGLTQIPLDRPPFPLPPLVDTPLYFTIQPGGAYLSKPARVIYPNTKHHPQGTRIDFFRYSPSGRGWYSYGSGSPSADGSQIVPDSGIGIRYFYGAMINGGETPPGTAPRGGARDGDPVDLGSGLLVVEKTDLALPGLLPVALTRTYRQNDTYARSFGIGATHPYAMFLWSASQYTEADLVMPDGSKIHYVRTSSGTGWIDAVFEAQSTSTGFYKSKIVWNGDGWDLTLRDGLVYVFGENAPLQAIRDRYGNTVSVLHANGQTGNVTTVRSPGGRWLSFTYDASNRITQAKDNIGRTATYTYDASGRLWKATDPAGGVTEYLYDASHRMTSIKDPRAITYLTNTYDASGRVSTQTQADGGTFTFAYTTGGGNITQTDVTDPRGKVRRVVFNADGFPTSDTRALGTAEAQQTATVRQSGTSAVLSTTDALARKTAFVYDAMGNVTSVTRLADTADAVTTSLTYEAVFNQPTSVTDPLTHATTLTYDARGNALAVTDALGHARTMTYDTAGLPLTVRDGLNNQTTLTYDQGDLVSATDPVGGVTKSFTDSAGRVARVTDALGASTRTVFDALNQPTQVIDGQGGTTSFTYDTNGNRLSVTDARGGVTSTTFDSMDRAITRTDPLSKVDSFTYDLAGNVVTATDRRGKVTALTYDALNRATFTGFGQVGGSYESTITTTYDAGDRATSIVDSVAGTISSTFDGLDRLTAQTTPQGTVTYAFDAADRRTSLGVPGQSAVTYTYDVADRLTGLTRGSAAVAVSYDAADRRTSLSLPGGVSTDYAYDTASRPTALTYKRGSTTLGDITYGYDAASRRNNVGGTFGRLGLPQTVSSATYDAANRQTVWAGTTFTYDDAGDLTSDATNSYTWNARGQLATIAGGSAASFVHDGLGRRMRRTVGGATTDYLYDGADAVQEIAGGSPSANMLTGLGIDEVFTRTDAAGTSTFLADALGSTVALTDSAGVVQTEYTYEPFGKTTVTGGASTNRTRFTGREDDGTGLYFYRARYMNPTTGRFISQDPIGFGGGDPNLYAYVGNSPTNFTDPSGKIIPLLAGILVGALIGGGAYTAATKLTGRKFSWTGFGVSALTGALAGAAIGYLLAGAASVEVGSVISVTADRYAHVLLRHTVGGASSLGKSVFFRAGDILALVARAGIASAVQQAYGGNFQRVVDAGRAIGIDRATGLPTSIYTVITTALGELVTMFPGLPR